MIPIANFLEDALDTFLVGLWKIAILIVSGIYNMVNAFFRIFTCLAGAEIFRQSDYEALTNKVYVLLGVVMLFIIAYNIILYVIDPDKDKGGASTEKLLKKIVLSLIIIVLCPTIFKYAFTFQNIIIEENVIGKIFAIDDTADAIADGEDPNASYVVNGARKIAATTFAAFFVPTESTYDEGDVYNASIARDVVSTRFNCPTNDGSVGCISLENARTYAEETGDFVAYLAFARNCRVNDGETEATTATGGTAHSTDFSWFFSLVAGIYLCYIIISFCFDMAVRIVKLAFFEIIAPLCVACQIIPGKESIFKNWYGSAFKTYLSSFVRIFIMNLSIFLITVLTGSTGRTTDGTATTFSDFCENCTGVSILVKAFVIIGILTFMKQASKLIDEIFGLGDTKLGLGEKIKDATTGGLVGTGLVAAGAAAAGARGSRQGFFSKTQGFKTMNHKERAKAIGKGMASGLTRGVSASVRNLSGASDGFGFNALKDQVKKTKDAEIAAADKAAIGETKFVGKANDVRSIISQRSEHKENKREVEEFKQQLQAAKMEKSRWLRELQSAEADLKEITENGEYGDKALSELKKALHDAKKRESDLHRAGAPQVEIDKAKEMVNIATDNLNSAQHKRDLLYYAEKELSDEVKEIRKKYDIASENVDTVTIQYEDALDREAKFAINSYKEDARDWTVKFATGVDRDKAKALVKKYDDEIVSSAQKLLDKYKASITVSMKDSLGKNELLAPSATSMATALSSKTVQDIESIANSLSLCSTATEFAAAMGTDVPGLVTAVGYAVDNSNFSSFKEAFITTVKGAYAKQCVGATADAIITEDSEHILSTAKKTTILDDLDSRDVKTAAESYKMVVEQTLPSETVPKTAKERKKLGDRIREDTAASQRREAQKQVQKDIAGVNDTSKKN